MDINQLSQIVQYIDEERRKDRALIVQLSERVEVLTRELDARSRYTQTLESSLTEIRIQLQKAMGWTSSVEQLRAEFSQVIERVEDQRSKTERESSRVRQIEIESMVRQLNEIKKEVKPYQRYAEDLDLRRQEEARLNEMISRVQAQVIDVARRLEEPGTAIAYLEEQRRSDNKRILEVEQAVPEVRKRIEQLAPQLLLLDEAIRRKQIEIEEAARLLEAQNQVIESQRVADIRRERQFAEYGSIVERIKERITDLQSQTTGFIQMREEVRRALNELPEVQARLEVRLNEVVEIQRDSEERARRQAEEFRDSVYKDWKTYTVSQEEKWYERDKRIVDFEPRLTVMEDEIAILIPQIKPMYDILEHFSRSYAAAGRDWLSQANQLLDQARTNIPSETKLSRRQRKKQRADISPPKSDPGTEVGIDDDLVS